MATKPSRDGAPMFSATFVTKSDAVENIRKTLVHSGARQRVAELRHPKKYRTGPPRDDDKALTLRLVEVAYPQRLSPKFVGRYRVVSTKGLATCIHESRRGSLPAPGSAIHASLSAVSATRRISNGPYAIRVSGAFQRALCTRHESFVIPSEGLRLDDVRRVQIRETKKNDRND